MEFIRRWSYCCANYLMKQQNEGHEKRSVYYYGFQVIIGGIVKVVLLLTISLILGTVVPTLIALLSFALLRSFAGGFHMDTYGKCIAASLALFVLTGVIARYTYMYWTVNSVIILIFISFLLGMAVIYRWAPADTHNKPITRPEEIKRFRRLSFLFMVVWLFAVLLLLHFNLIMFIISCCLGTILETFTITPAGYGFFGRISGKISINK